MSIKLFVQETAKKRPNQMLLNKAIRKFDQSINNDRTHTHGQLHTYTHGKFGFSNVKISKYTRNI